MKATLLALALVCVKDDVRDMEFVRMQEEWVAAIQPPSHSDSMLEPLIRQLGDSHYINRVAAEKAISANPISVFRQLIIASHSRDAEIASRARLLLKDLYACSDCKGSGKCPQCFNLTDSERNAAECRCYSRRCLSCMGTGDRRLRTTSNWTDESLERNLFPFVNREQYTEVEKP